MVVSCAVEWVCGCGVGDIVVYHEVGCWEWQGEGMWCEQVVIIISDYRSIALGETRGVPVYHGSIKSRAGDLDGIMTLTAVCNGEMLLSLWVKVRFYVANFFSLDYPMSFVGHFINLFIVGR